MNTPADKFPKSSLFGGSVFLGFGLLLFFQAREAVSGGTNVPTEYGAGWMPPSLTYGIAIFFFLVAGYLFVGYFLQRTRSGKPRSDA